MARTSDEVAARRAARQRLAQLHQAQRDQDARIERYLVEAELSRTTVRDAEDALSEAERQLAAATEAHEARMARIVAAFRGDNVDVDTIASLLELTPTKVRSLVRKRPKDAPHTSGAIADQPSLSEEQDGANGA